jgi:hypothetical protein
MKNHETLVTARHGKRRNRRRKYLINPAFQAKYAVTISVAVLLMSTILSSVLYGVLHHQARQRLIHPETYTSEVSLVIFLAGVAFAVLTAGALGVWFIIVTHRMCGPLYVMERYLKELTNGRIPSVRPLRRKDEFKEFFATFEGAIDSLKASRWADIETLTEALSVMKLASEKDGAARSDDLEKAAGHLQRMLTAAREAVGCKTEESHADQTTNQATVPRSKQRTPVSVT